MAREYELKFSADERAHADLQARFRDFHRIQMETPYYDPAAGLLAAGTGGPHQFQPLRSARRIFRHYAEAPHVAAERVDIHIQLRRAVGGGDLGGHPQEAGTAARDGGQPLKQLRRTQVH